MTIIFVEILLQNIILLFYIAVGLVMVKKNWLKQDGQQTLSVLVTNFALPCAVFNSFQLNYSQATLRLIFYSLALAVLFFASLFVTGRLTAKILKLQGILRNIWVGCCTFSSVLFIGIPIVSALFGSQGLVILMAFNTIGNLFLFGFGESIFAGKLLIEPQKIIRTPAIIAAVLGFVLFVGQVQLPAVILTPVQALAGFTTPLAMMINGALLSQRLSFKLFTNRQTLLFCLVRLILIPVVLILFFKSFITNQLLLQIVSIIACMPSGAVNSVFAEKYSGDGTLASEMIILSTLFSIVTIPTVFYCFF